MKFAFYPGCIVQTEQYGYEISARKVFTKLGIQLIDIEGFSCCGYPLKNVSVPAWLYLSVRKLQRGGTLHRFENRKRRRPRHPLWGRTRMVGRHDDTMWD